MTVGIMRVVKNQRPPQAITVLQTEMTMIPICALGDNKLQHVRGCMEWIRTSLFMNIEVV